MLLEGKIKIAFICIGNSCRSQMAEGMAKYFAGDIFETFSAGTHPALTVAPMAIKVMNEIGMDISKQYPKGLSDIPQNVDILVIMGENIEYPKQISYKYIENWGIDDPYGLDYKDYLVAREKIRDRLKNLIKRINNKEIKI